MRQRLFRHIAVSPRRRVVSDRAFGANNFERFERFDEFEIN